MSHDCTKPPYFARYKQMMHITEEENRQLQKFLLDIHKTLEKQKKLKTNNTCYTVITKVKRD